VCVSVCLRASSTLTYDVQFRSHSLIFTNSVANMCLLTCKGGAGVVQSVQCPAADWTTGRSRFDPRQGQRIFSLTSVSRPALGPIQPPVQWVPGGPFPEGKSSAGA
jgi:hypothetical protein